MSRLRYLGFSACCLWLSVAVLPTASAAEPSSEALESRELSLDRGIFGSGQWGTRGLLAVEQARSLERLAFVLTLREEYFQTRNLVTRGDKDSSSAQELYVVFSPVAGLELALRQVSINNSYLTETQRSVQVQGNPALRIKYARSMGQLADMLGRPGPSALLRPLGVGLMLDVILPTSEYGSGLEPRAITLPVRALASYRFLPNLELALNIGYTYDRTRILFAGQLVDSLRRMVYQINPPNYLTYGAGLIGHVPAGPYVALSPYAEWSGMVAPKRVGSENPMLVTAGLKGYLRRSRSLEISAGAKARLHGRPSRANGVSGLPPWQAFAQISVHLGEMGYRRSTEASAPIAIPTPLLAPVAPTQALSQATVKLAGRVEDARTHDGLGGALVALGTGDVSQLVTDRQGAFHIWPVEGGAKAIDLTITARGYKTQTVHIEDPSAQAAMPLVVALAPAAQLATGQLRGVVRDEAHNKPIAAELYLPALDRAIQVGADGAFSVTLPEGSYEVLISAKGFKTRHQRADIEAGGSVVLVVEMLTGPTKKHAQ